jgi:hypothetical protein
MTDPITQGMETASARETSFERWACRVEGIVAQRIGATDFSLDGDQQRNGYSLDMAMVMYHEQLKPSAAAAVIAFQFRCCRGAHTAEQEVSTLSAVTSTETVAVVSSDHQFHDELVSRAAPRWAWEIIGQTLACDAQSKSFDAETRADVDAALKGMVLGSELGGDLGETLSRQDVEGHRFDF